MTSPYNWRRQALEQGEILPSRGSALEQGNSEDRFQGVELQVAGAPILESTKAISWQN